MAAYFGEILEPTTRAIFDEYSDEEQDSQEAKLQLSWLLDNESAASGFDVFFIIHGRLSLVFSEAYLIDEDLSLAGEINIVNEDEKTSKGLPSRIYQKNGILLCLVSPSVTPDLSYSFVTTISNLLQKSEKVIVLSSDSLYSYKTTSYNDLPPAFIKELKTCNNSNFLADELPIPNIVTGIPAAVVSWCHIFKKDASVYICYSDQQLLDSVTASPYLTLLKKMKYDIIRNQKPDLSKKLFYGKPDIIGGASNLYI